MGNSATPMIITLRPGLAACFVVASLAVATPEASAQTVAPPGSIITQRDVARRNIQTPYIPGTVSFVRTVPDRSLFATATADAIRLTDRETADVRSGPPPAALAAPAAVGASVDLVGRPATQAGEAMMSQGAMGGGIGGMIGGSVGTATGAIQGALAPLGSIVPGGGR